METKRNSFDELVRKSLEGFAPEPSPKVWKGIGRQLSWKEFVRFDFSNFSSNIFQLAAAGILLVTGITVSITQTDFSKEKEVKPQPVETQDLTPLPLPDDSSTYQVITEIMETSEEPVIAKPVENVNETNSEPEKNAQALEILPEPPSEQFIFSAREKYPNTQSLNSREIYIAGDLPSPAPRMSAWELQAKVRTQNETQQDSTSGFRLGIAGGWHIENLRIPYEQNPFENLYNTGDLSFRIEKGNFTFQAGLGYSRTFDRLNYDISYKTFDSVGFVYNVHYYVPDPSNPSSVILITSKQTLYDSVLHTNTDFTYAKYDNLLIPVNVAFRFLEAGPFRLNLVAGGALQFNISKEEPLPDYMNYLKSSMQVTPVVVKRSDFNWHLIGGLRAQYILRKKWSLEIEPLYRRYMNPVKVDNVNVYPYSWGCRVGIGYYF